MKLAVVIVAYDKPVEVLTCLNSLRALATDAGAIGWHVQDDTSPSLNFQRVIPQEIATVGRNATNLGFAANANAGAWNAIQLYQPDVIMLTNQDVYAVEEWSAAWDTALLSAFNDPLVGIVAPRLLFPDGRIQSVGGVFDNLCQPVHRCLGWTNPHALDTPEEVDWTTGAALAIRTSLFIQLGGFDEQYERGYFEDADLCVRVRQAGYKVIYQPHTTFMHSVGSTGGSPYFMKNALRFRDQWVSTGKVKPGTLSPVQRFW